MKTKYLISFLIAATGAHAAEPWVIDQQS
ncbi:MAG: hypothetical protein ACI9MB_003423, partial [Verrucomicrobiales bacterium]